MAKRRGVGRGAGRSGSVEDIIRGADGSGPLRAGKWGRENVWLLCRFGLGDTRTGGRQSFRGKIHPHAQVEGDDGRLYAQATDGDAAAKADGHIGIRLRGAPSIGGGVAVSR